MTRRNLTGTLAGGASIALMAGYRTAWAEAGKPPLGFKQYGMKKIPVREAIRQIARIGYKAVSLTLMPTWDTEPKLLPLEFYGMKEHGPEIARQQLAIKEHALDPLKGTLLIPEEEYTFLSSEAVKKGKGEEWRKEKLK